MRRIENPEDPAKRKGNKLSVRNKTMNGRFRHSLTAKRLVKSAPPERNVELTGALCYSYRRDLTRGGLNAGNCFLDTL